MKSRRYLELLSKKYKTIEEASSEIIELTAVSVLPKGTEYFLSDLHGQHDAFARILRSASGNTRDKISLEFGGSLSENEKNQLSNLIYEPSKFMNLMKDNKKFTPIWIRKTIINLLRVLERVAAKYSRHKVRTKIPGHYRELIDEMLNVSGEEMNKSEYFNTLIDTIIEIDASFDFIRTICHVIQDLSIDHLHIVGDIYDRGVRPDKIVDILMSRENVDLQFGNHDVLWIGAALGNESLICNVIRNALSYSNYESIEAAYAINLRPLSVFAESTYGDDPCERFQPRILTPNKYDNFSKDITAKMYKAISMIQFKLTSQLIDRNPELGMDHRNVFRKVDFKRNIYTDWDGKEYPLLDDHFPTIDPDFPSRLTEEEKQIISLLKSSFAHSEKLQKHIRYLLNIGSVYKIMNSNILVHGCIPLEKDGSFSTFEYEGEVYSGKSLLDFFDNQVRLAQHSTNKLKRQKAIDMFWYMWCGPKSPMFGKSQLSAFENLFVDDKGVREEYYNPYYTLSKEEKYVDKIFEEFGLDPKRSHIINGHVPVKMKDGEKPISANGKVYVIDGGISKAYQPKTGIAGYTLTFNSHNLSLAEHSNYETMETVHGAYTPKVHVTEKFSERILIKDTDEGKALQNTIEELKELLNAYRTGEIREDMD